MALIVTNTEVKQTLFNNTNITIDNLYVRLTYFAKSNGINVEVELIPYIDKPSYLEAKDIKNLNLPRVISGEVLRQDLLDIHNLVKSKLEDLGYNVTLDLTI